MSSVDTTNITLETLSLLYHLPTQEAAKKLEVCPTIFKRICRKQGLKRWPYRKIHSINSLIESLEKTIKANEGEIPKINMDMNDLLAKKKYLMENPNVSYKSVISKYCINSFRAKVEQATPARKQKIDTPIKKKTFKRKISSSGTVKNENFTKLHAAKFLSDLSEIRPGFLESSQKFCFPIDKMCISYIVNN